MSDYRSHDFKVGHCECFVEAWDADERDPAGLMIHYALPATPERPSLGSSWIDEDVAGFRMLAHEILAACDALEAGGPHTDHTQEAPEVQ
ncbi:MAG: hypothetical protein EBR82_43845 [Caulobacteraceae bacterium]|nr:hypothetical protein [Caulobacteraceae bacterium]